MSTKKSIRTKSSFITKINKIWLLKILRPFLRWKSKRQEIDLRISQLNYRRSNKFKDNLYEIDDESNPELEFIVAPSRRMVVPSISDRVLMGVDIPSDAHLSDVQFAEKHKTHVIKINTDTGKVEQEKYV